MNKITYNQFKKIKYTNLDICDMHNYLDIVGKKHLLIWVKAQ
jgi:hypothetical protein